MTLSDYLQARWAEIERAVTDVIVESAYLADCLDDLNAYFAADLVAKRATLRLHRREAFHDAPDEYFCRHCQRSAGVYPCLTVRFLAQPFSTRDDFQDEWRV